MLILSRRANQEIVFPHLGIQISVLKVQGRLVKLGVEAPDSVSILRKELTEQPPSHADTARPDAADAERLTHRQRNELNLLHLRLEAIQRRLDRGEEINAQWALDSLLDQYATIDHEMADDNESAAHVLGDRPIRLLVVEDCDNERELMAYLLAAQGFDVRSVGDGEQALEQLRTEQPAPDFVLMDMHMPGATGLETLMQIRSDERLERLRVFAVTGMARDLEAEPLSNGWDGWFQKPLDVGALVASLHAASASPQLETA